MARHVANNDFAVARERPFVLSLDPTRNKTAQWSRVYSVRRLSAGSHDPIAAVASYISPLPQAERGEKERKGAERSKAQRSAHRTLNSSCQKVTIYTVSELAVLR